MFPEGGEGAPGPDYGRLDAELQSALSGTDAQFRANFSRAMAIADDIWRFDPERIADLYASERASILRWLDEMRAWCDSVHQEFTRNRGLRVVGGKK
jgi:hypothetical protein